MSLVFDASDFHHDLVPLESDSLDPHEVVVIGLELPPHDDALVECPGVPALLYQTSDYLGYVDVQHIDLDLFDQQHHRPLDLFALELHP